ncbi:hypothetical protein BJX76DRAFT_281528 [Aspergillus varians]
MQYAPCGQSSQTRQENFPGPHEPWSRIARCIPRGHRLRGRHWADHALNVMGKPRFPSAWVQSRSCTCRSYISFSPAPTWSCISSTFHLLSILSCNPPPFQP